MVPRRCWQTSCIRVMTCEFFIGLSHFLRECTFSQHLADRSGSATPSGPSAKIDLRQCDTVDVVVHSAEGDLLQSTLDDNPNILYGSHNLREDISRNAGFQHALHTAHYFHENVGRHPVFKQRLVKYFFSTWHHGTKYQHSSLLVSSPLIAASSNCPVPH